MEISPGGAAAVTLCANVQKCDLFTKRILAMTLYRSLAGKQLFTILNIAAVAVLTGVIMNAQAAVPQLDAETTLARAAAAYYEARFSDTIAMLAPLNASLERQPARIPELVRTKLQLALAHIGLNQVAQAKMLFSELYELDPEFSLDETKFAPKVVALFEEAKAAHDERKCEICDSVFEEAVDAYKRNDLPEAQAKIQSVLALNPQHHLAGEYLVVIDNRLRLSIEQLTLSWNAQFGSGDFAQATETYRQLVLTNYQDRAATSLEQVRGEYRKAVAEISKSWTQACVARDQKTMDSLRRKANGLLPEAAIARDILDQMNNCAGKPVNPVQAVAATQSEPELNERCLENSSAVALIRLKSRVEPRLPPELEQKGNVRVNVSVKIDNAGNTRVYQVRGASMPLTKAVIAAVDQWKFHPATHNDRPTCVETEFPIVVSP
jgi:tetratricopeptide (TPR) repeat protein